MVRDYAIASETIFFGVQMDMGSEPDPFNFGFHRSREVMLYEISASRLVVFFTTWIELENRASECPF